MVHTGRICYEDGRERVTIIINRHEWSKVYSDLPNAFYELWAIGAVEKPSLLPDHEPTLLRGNARESTYIFKLPHGFDRSLLREAGFDCARKIN